MKARFERFVELSAKDVTEHLDGKKEIVAWFDPARCDRQTIHRLAPPMNIVGGP